MTRRLVLVLLSLIALSVLATCGKNASWRQKLTVHIETPDGVRAFSGVSEVDFQGQVKWAKELSTIKTRLRGEAVVMELEGRYVFVLLGGVDDLFYDTLRAQREAHLAYSDAIPLIRKQTDPLDVPRQFWPMMVTFKDSNDPTSVEEVDQDNLAELFGAGYGVQRVTIQATGEPVAEGQVEQILEWLPSKQDNLLPTSSKYAADVLPIEKIGRPSFTTKNK